MIHQPDILRLGPDLSTCGAAAELEVLYECDGVTVGQHVAVGILDDASGLGGLRFRPFMAARGAFPAVGMAEDVTEQAGWAGVRGQGA